MAVNSMTGFARTQGRADSGLSWTWEARSVNHKGLDVRCRVPSGFETVEQAVRKAVAKRFKRGSVSVNMVSSGEEGPVSYRINETLLAELVEASGALDLGGAVAPPRLDGLLAIKGVLVPEDAPADEAETMARDQQVLAGLEEVLAALADMRAQEGARLEALLTEQLDHIATLTDKTRGLAALQPEAIKARLSAQVALLLGESPSLPEDRLAQEAALLAVKADIREEVDRLEAHVAAARHLLGEGGSIGRKLDFLCQEFNREANTLCSKSSDTDLTAIGLQLKTVIDQMREQVQNME